MDTARDSIRNYNLFGETGEIPDVVHCETIETRSRMHNWELRPHRHARLHQFLLIEKGGGRADLDGRTVALVPGTALSIPHGHVHGFAFRDDTSGWVVTLTSDLVDQSLHPGAGLRPLLGVPRAVPCTSDLRRLVQRIFAEYAGQGFARALVLRSQAGSLIGLMARAIAADTGMAGSGRGHPLFRRFESLVEAQFRARQPVAVYAAQLAVSPTHLNRIVRQATGGSASALIAERMLREARRLLTYTNRGAAEIAYDLGFADPAHFSRAFRRGTGLAPRDFRRRMERGG
ncbi:MAG: helix-turn-helix domain-containing protein [Jhaorihella sp.]